MVSIVVEASNCFCSIACLENNKVLSQRNMECSNNLSAIILQEIDNCLNDAGKSKKDLTEIIASNGPGSYTAIRVVAAICKTLAYTLKLPLKVVSSLKLQALLEFESNKLIVPLIDARRNNVFAAVYKVENKKLIVVNGEEKIRATTELSGVYRFVIKYSKIFIFILIAIGGIFRLYKNSKKNMK